MTKFRLTLACLATLFALTALPNLAQAWEGGGNGPGFGHGGFLRPDRAVFGMWGRSPSSLYNLGHIPVPPYFALHPPVYYGQRVFRSYGESPFPRSGLQRYQVEIIAPANIVNPFVKQMVPEPVEEDVDAAPQVASSPSQLILNPFYHQSDKALVSQ
jgi:hypothetical protein